jgi:hypothetical protein
MAKSHRKPQKAEAERMSFTNFFKERHFLNFLLIKIFVYSHLQIQVVHIKNIAFQYYCSYEVYFVGMLWCSDILRFI